MFWKKKDAKKPEKINALTRKQVTYIWITVIVVVSLWLINLVVLKNRIAKDAIDDRGTFGDMFGAVNALFSGLAFAGIIWTILLQRNELRLQREDSKLSRNEAVDQNKTLKLQRFENTFFNMLNLRNEIFKNFKYRNFEGRVVIDEAQKELFGFLSLENYRRLQNSTQLQLQNVLKEIPQSDVDAKSMLHEFYRPYFYNRFASNFNHYYRHLYHIFKFIYFSNLDSKEKNFYATLVRAQLSQRELYLIAFNNLINGFGNPNFLYLTKEYDILQNMDWSFITPPAFKTLIENEIRDVTYPFALDKPTGTNH